MMMNQPIPENEMKKDMRREVKAALADMDDHARHEASVRACARLTELYEFAHASVVMLYMPLVTEVDVTPLALKSFQQGKTVCVPKMDWDRNEIIPVEVMSFDDRVMNVDEHGIRVPKDGRAVSPSLIDLVVVPGIAFDVQGNRLGRGGGHYDRFLARLKAGATKVAIAFDNQIVDQVPTLAHDMPVDIVVTERRMTKGNSARSRQ
jgi:5-formyltetrahydrofolate cyclo-ligase